MTSSATPALSLAGIFNSLESPLPHDGVQQADAQASTAASTENGDPQKTEASGSGRPRSSLTPELVLAIQHSLDETLRSRLFNYQRATVQAMIRKELTSGHGGILCENMGTGKTLICLAVVAVSSRIRLLPSGLISSAARTERVVILGRDLAASSGSSSRPPEKDASNDTLGWWRSSSASPRVGNVEFSRRRARPMSLTDQCAWKIVRTVLSPSPTGMRQEDSILLPQLRATVPDHLVARVMDSRGWLLRVDGLAMSPTRRRRSFRGLADNGLEEYDDSSCHVLALARATLIVVPDTLKSQWLSEINKHVLDGSMRVLVIAEDKEVPIPPVSTLISHDLVLISHARLAHEHSVGGLTRTFVPPVPRACQCPYIGSSRLRECRCSPFSSTKQQGRHQPDVNGSTTSVTGLPSHLLPPRLAPETQSPLLYVHFLRIIFDEGHLLKTDVLARPNQSHLMAITAQLSADYWWISSGTPLPGVGGEDDGIIDDRRRIAVEKVDLQRLSGIVSSFLKIEPFASDKHLFKKRVMDPWVNGKPNAVEVVRTLFDTVMVRHRLSDIANEKPLPPLREKVVLLAMNAQERINMNVLISQIKLNSILTEREGVDYFGHHRNREWLHQIVSNLRLALFHFNGHEIIEQALESLNRARAGLEVAETKRYDAELLKQIIHCLECVEADPFYRVVQRLEEMPYIVSKQREPLFSLIQPLDVFVFRHKQTLPIDGSYMASNALPVPVSDDVVRAHSPELIISDAEDSDGGGKSSFVVEFPTPPPDFSGKRHPISLAIVTDSEPAHKRPRTNVGALSPSSDVGEQFGFATSSVDVNGSEAPAAKKKKTVGFVVDALPSSAMQIEDVADVMRREERDMSKRWCTGLAGDGEDPGRLDIVGTASTKLSYVAAEILKHHKTDKIIVYTTNNNEMHAVKEFCDIARIKCLLFQKDGQRASAKSQNVTTFNTTPELRVFIMDVSRGAFGIDLSTVSRIYFLRPVPDPAVYRQAVKRAHRLGCASTVYVEVLAFRGTVEVDGLIAGDRGGGGDGAESIAHQHAAAAAAEVPAQVAGAPPPAADAAGGEVTTAAVVGAKRGGRFFEDLKMREQIDEAPFVAEDDGGGIEMASSAGKGKRVRSEADRFLSWEFCTPVR
ncbi:SNF2 family N-terminal domain-containing protein [Zopfochytrium polystomum]|nr:SNF2 family N-terminal domain-containing protein [Zopfochytrium polystomum]